MRTGRILLTLVLGLAAAPNPTGPTGPTANRFRCEMDTGRNMEIGDRLKGKVIVLFASTVVQWYRRTTTFEDPDQDTQLLGACHWNASHVCHASRLRHVQPDVKVSQVASREGDDNSKRVEDPWSFPGSDRVSDREDGRGWSKRRSGVAGMLPSWNLSDAVMMSRTRSNGSGRE